MSSKVVMIEPDPFKLDVVNKVKAFNPLGAFSEKEGNEAANEAFIKDPKKYDKQNAILNAARSQDFSVSRPVNGILAKPNTHAFVQVLDARGAPVKCFNNIGRKFRAEASGYYLKDRAAYEGKSNKQAIADAFNASPLVKILDGFDDPSGEPTQAPSDDGSPNSDVWTDWILQSVHESRIEKTQVVETFGASYFYAFGERPRSISFSGLLMNTTDYNWRSIFWENWDKFFRATRLVEKDFRLYIAWDDIIVEGYPINATCSEVADSPNAMKFSFNLFVTRYINVSAKSGFLTQKYMRIAQLRSGSGLGMIDRGSNSYRLLGGESFSPKSFNFDRSGGFGLESMFGSDLFGRHNGAQYRKFSLAGLMGPTLSTTITKGLLTQPALREAYETTRLGREVIDQIGYASDALLKWGYKIQRGDQLTDIHVNSFTRRMLNDLTVAVAQDVVTTFEDAANIRHGDVNQLLGNSANLIVDAASNTSVNKWGKPFSLSKHAKVTSVERLVKHFIIGTTGAGNTGNAAAGIGTVPGGMFIVGEDGSAISMASDEYQAIITEEDRLRGRPIRLEDTE